MVDRHVRGLTAVASFIGCCREAFFIVGWLAAWVPAPQAQVAGASRAAAAEIFWRVAGEARGTPAIAGDRAYFLSKRHELVALDSDSGRVSWRRTTRGPGPTTAGTNIVIGQTGVIAGDGGLIAFTHEGVERWRLEAEQSGYPGTYLGDRVADLVLAGSSIGRLWAVDIDSGAVRWFVEVSKGQSAIVFAPVVADRMVVAPFMASDDLRHGGLVAVSLATGRELWRRALAFGGGPVVSGALVLVADQEGSIHAFDLRSGAPRWVLHAATKPASGPEFRALAAAGDVLIAGSLGGRVTAYDLATRQERWSRTPVTASIVFGFATDSRRVYVPYLAGQLVALDIGSGAELWRTDPALSGFSWRPLIATGRLLAASSGAGFFAFRL